VGATGIEEEEEVIWTLFYESASLRPRGSADIVEYNLYFYF
jgi:hypothetical protein